MDFYETFVTRCRECGRAPSSVAESAGISRASVSRWKRGAVPSDVTISAIVAALGMSLRDFWGDKSSTDFSTFLPKQARSSESAQAILIKCVAAMDDDSAAQLLSIARAAGLLASATQG